MKIKFRKSCELEVTETFDEATDTASTVNETFKKGEIVDGDVCHEYDNDHVDFQFGDGSVAMGIPKSLFEIVEK